MSAQLIKSNDLQKLLKYKESLQSWGDIVQRTLSLELTISLELQFKGNANSLNIVIATVVNNIIFITTIIIIIIIIHVQVKWPRFDSVFDTIWGLNLLAIYSATTSFSKSTPVFLSQNQLFPFCLGWLQYYFDFMVSMISKAIEPGHMTLRLKGIIIIIAILLLII